jgi:hypothetical protein
MDDTRNLVVSDITVRVGNQYDNLFFSHSGCAEPHFTVDHLVDFFYCVGVFQSRTRSAK